jgi:hypothetical protein
MKFFGLCTALRAHPRRAVLRSRADRGQSCRDAIAKAPRASCSRRQRPSLLRRGLELAPCHWRSHATACGNFIW